MKKNNKLKYIAMTSVSIFSLATVFVATFAWFTVARNVDTNGSGFEVVSYDGLIKSASAHMFKELDSDGNYVFYDSSEDSSKVIDYTVNEKTGQITSSNSATISFGTYDTLMPQDAYAVMFLIEVDSNIANSRSNGIKVTPSTTTTEAENLANKENFKQEDNPMSSIVDFFYGSNASSTMTVTKPDSRQQFLTFTSTTETSYKQTLDGNSYTAFDGDSYFLQIVCEYNISNIESIYTINEDNEILSISEDNTDISYKQDWKITIS